MRTKYIFLTFAFMFLIGAVVVLSRAGAAPSDQSPEESPAGVNLDLPEEPESIPTTGAVTAKATPEAQESQAEPDLDGQTLVQSKCVKCHTLQWLSEKEKTRDEWEKTLKLMVFMGAYLSDTEKEAVLDYLTPRRPAVD
jgi:hypothetical protein